MPTNLYVRSAIVSRLNPPAGSTASLTAPIKLTTGALMTAAETGAIEFDGTHLYWTNELYAPFRMQLDSFESTVITSDFAVPVGAQQANTQIYNYRHRAVASATRNVEVCIDGASVRAQLATDGAWMLNAFIAGCKSGANPTDSAIW